MGYFVLFSLLSVHIVYAGDIDIIASQSCQIESISQKDLRALFLKKKSVVDHIFVQVLDNKEQKTYQYFVKHFLKKSMRQIKTYWLHMLFTGRKLPPQTFNIHDIQQYHPNICYFSYIPKHSVIPHWKVVTVK